MTQLVIHRSDLGELHPLGSGGTAKVYRAPGFRDHDIRDVVYKEYKQKTLRQAGPGLRPGLQALVELRARMPDSQRTLVDKRTLWPLRVIEDDDRAAVGILMDLIPQSFFQVVRRPSGGVSTDPREALFLFLEDDMARRLGVTPITSPTRIALCGQIARSLGLLHRADVVFGDVSARNIIYDIDSPEVPQVILVDCDSVRLKGTRSAFGSQPHTPTWEPPESLRARNRLRSLHQGGKGDASEIKDLQRETMIQSKPTDVYKFGLLVVRILDYGRQRTANRSPERANLILERHLGGAVSDLLTHSLAESPEDRPTMREWYEGITGNRPASPHSEHEKATQVVNRIPPTWRWDNGRLVRDVSEPTR